MRCAVGKSDLEVPMLSEGEDVLLMVVDMPGTEAVVVKEGEDAAIICVVVVVEECIFVEGMCSGHAEPMCLVIGLF